MPVTIAIGLLSMAISSSSLLLIDVVVAVVVATDVLFPKCFVSPLLLSLRDVLSFGE